VGKRSKESIVKNQEKLLTKTDQLLLDLSQKNTKSLVISSLILVGYMDQLEKLLDGVKISQQD